MERAVIGGAGMAGLIAASMLRDQCSMIVEHSKEIPNNHHALLRFRSNAVSDATGIPFRKVRVMKAVCDPTNPIKDSINYSRKVTGRAGIRSIVGAQGEIEERYIAPGDFIQRMADQVRGKLHLNSIIQSHIGKGYPVISTIPMPALMSILDYPEELRPEFSARKGWSITCDLRDVDICATFYYPEPSVKQYRASITEGKMIIEGIGDFNFAQLNARQMVSSVASDFGMYQSFVPESIKVKEQKFAKISQCDEHLRKKFIMWASDTHQIYSLGRFATWRPSVMLDDIVKDVRVIQSIINGETSPQYKARKQDAKS